jgi:toxin ParE1/3/4
LLGIVDYIARQDAVAAAEFVGALDGCIQRLTDFPESGSLPRDEHLRRKGYRIVIFGDYLAFYRLRGAEVRIVRVLHGRRRYSGLL